MEKQQTYNSGTDILVFIASSYISVTCNIGFMHSCEEKGWSEMVKEGINLELRLAKLWD